jgi:hypothetical protein
LISKFFCTVERAVWGGGSKDVRSLLKVTTETESEVAEKSSWDPAKRGEKLGLVWRNRKKISQIINDYLYLPFFLLIILCM